MLDLAYPNKAPLLRQRVDLFLVSLVTESLLMTLHAFWQTYDPGRVILGTNQWRSHCSYHWHASGLSL